MKEKGKMRGWLNEEDASLREPKFLYNEISVTATKQAEGSACVCVSVHIEEEVLL